MKFKKLVENKEIKSQKDLVDQMDLEVKDANEEALKDHEENVKLFKKVLKDLPVLESFTGSEKNNNYVVNVKDRKQLAKLIESLKQNNIKHRISKSQVEGYRYDVTFKYELKEDVEKTEVKKITTPRGTFEVVDKTEDELRKDGYGYHHSGNGYKIFVKNNQAVAIKEAKQKGNNTPITDEDQKKEFEAEDENTWNESKKLTEDPTQDRIEEIRQISRQRQLNDDEVRELAELSRKKNENLTEGKVNANIYTILGWLANHKQAYNDFKSYFKLFDKGNSKMPTLDDIKGWISDHKELTQDYENFFDDKLTESCSRGRKLTEGEFGEDLILSKIETNHLLKDGAVDIARYVGQIEIHIEERPYEEGKYDIYVMNPYDEVKLYTSESLKENGDAEYDDTIYIYQFPAEINLNYLKQSIKLTSCNSIKLVGKVNDKGDQPGDILVSGTKFDLEKFADDYFDYELNPDYLYKEDEFDTDLITPIKSGKYSWEESKKLKEDSDKKNKKQPKTRFVGDGEEEIRFFNNANNYQGQNLAGQAVCESDEADDENTPLIDKDDKRPYTNRRRDALRKIKQKRPLTDDEYEELNYCDNEVSSRDAETRYLNGESLKEDKEDTEEEDILVDDDNILSDELDDIVIDDFDEIDLDSISTDDIVDEDESALDILKDKVDVKVEDGEVTIAEKGKLEDEEAPQLKVEVEEEQAEVIDNEFNDDTIADDDDEEKKPEEAPKEEETPKEEDKPEEEIKEIGEDEVFDDGEIDSATKESWKHMGASLQFMESSTERKERVAREAVAGQAPVEITGEVKNNASNVGMEEEFVDADLTDDSAPSF